ncbi:thiol:disulfide interchange protein DsbC [Paucibacter oligotrophus]|uniref:Thiol:disulfide interchange protein n=1 Tax=Roseateles oligotrophus TaxID=1769250 RepID=A0A840LC49_9BURK|nr:DsbC family protein [Roseateles oligotrophus]MBB4846194.1 thiol:disulfide interchange protein DsbC [Roseateles oligotrophus]
MSLLPKPLRRFSLCLSLLACLPLAATANEAVIRKALSERLNGLPKIEEVRPSPMPGLWEVRIGNELRYTDASGSFWVEGELFDLRTRKNLTEERLSKINAIDFAALPLKDAIVWKSGNGKRRIAVFADPNCGYCKRFERSLQDVKDVTVYTFLIPILGGDSPDKSRAIWCAKDSTSTWVNWMVEGKAPPKAMGACDDGAIERNMALARRHHVNGTPAIIFEDGSRVPGALNADQLEKRLQSVGKADKS